MSWRPAAAAAADLLPDLAMAPLRDLRVEHAGSRRLLRFTAEVVNLGEGPFELRGTRATPDAPMDTVTQRIFDDAGGWRNLPTPASMVFAGDGHDHWHVRDLERYTLTPRDRLDELGVGAKQGFCFFDNHPYLLSQPGAPPGPQYPGCGAADDTVVTMGLSVGWGDVYGWHLPGQYIDITGLAPGAYRLHATADPGGWFAEARDDNNATSIELLYDGADVIVLASQVMLAPVMAQP
ncbi:MAG TPA: lysyl oxidase family protein [Roseiflexaceae bacterium]|nr:lysyl oxidase family protein [Roseiflexaceae bacterium]